MKSYDNTEVLAVGDTAPTNVVSMQDSTLEAVKKGMLGYTQPGGPVYNAFRNCVVTAGAKTGTSELGGNQTENGVFVCFAGMYMSGVPHFCILFALAAGLAVTGGTFYLSRRFGSYGLQKLMASRRHPRRIIHRRAIRRLLRIRNPRTVKP